DRRAEAGGAGVVVRMRVGDDEAVQRLAEPSCVGDRLVRIGEYELCVDCDDPCGSLNDLCRDVEAVVGGRVAVNAYLALVDYGDLAVHSSSFMAARRSFRRRDHYSHLGAVRERGTLGTAHGQNWTSKRWRCRASAI